MLTGLVVTALAGLGMAFAPPATAEDLPPDIDMTLSNATCSTGDDGSITVGLVGLVPGGSYSWTLGWGAAVHFTAIATTAEIPLNGLPPGNYFVEAELTGEGVLNFEWRGFAIEPCQPQVTLTVTQCTASGGAGALGAGLSSLVDGVVYTVTGPDGSTSEVVGDATGTSSGSYPSVPAGTTPSVSVEATWTVDEPYEEPPFLGNGGNFTPLESVALAGSAAATLNPCPAPVVVTPTASDPTPTAPAPTPVTTTSTDTALAATGIDLTNPLTGGLILLACGAAALIIDRRRRAAQRAPGDDVD